MCLYRRMLCTQEVSKRCNLYQQLFVLFLQQCAPSVLLLHLCVLL